MSRVPNPVVLERAPASSNSPCPRSTVLRAGRRSATKSRTPVGAAADAARPTRRATKCRPRVGRAVDRARPPPPRSAASPSPRRTAGGMWTQCGNRHRHRRPTWVGPTPVDPRRCWMAPSLIVSGMWTSLPKDTWIDGAVRTRGTGAGHLAARRGRPCPSAFDGPLDRVRRRAGQVAAAVAFIFARRHGRRRPSPRARATSWPPTPARRGRRGGPRAAARSARSGA